MCRRCIRMLLLVIGCVLLFFAVFPVLAFVHVGEPWQTGLIASKLVMLPVGAICLMVAARIEMARLPRRH
jgi:hypothetical protein